MKIKAVQWNIGGSLIRSEGDDPTVRGNYDTENVGYIAEQLGEYDADIVTLQETHSNEADNQIEEIAHRSGYQYWVNHPYTPSHLVDGQWLGQAVLTRTPFTGGEPEPIKLLSRRDWQAQQEDGEIWKWMDKGVSVVSTELANGVALSVATLHFPVFKRLGVDPMNSEAHSVLKEAQGMILKRVGQVALVQGDFNIDSASLRGYLHDLFACGFNQHIQREPTTPTGRRYDHVIARGARILTSHADTSVLTDHYPLITEIEV